MLKLRKPEILPINDHIWLLDDNHEATCYVVAGRERALIIDTSIGLCNIRETAEALTSLPLICVNTHGHGDHIGGNWAFEKAFMNLAWIGRICARGLSSFMSAIRRLSTSRMAALLTWAE